LVPAVQGSVPLGMTFLPAAVDPALSAYGYTAAASLSDKIASEICWAIETSPGGSSSPLSSAVYAGLDELQSPTAAVFYQRMSASIRRSGNWSD
jgi:hypothetical protein